MKIVTVLGARPQFIKATPVSDELRERGHTEFVVHTGQHYDADMSQVFFDELELPEPHVNLGVGSGTHALQTARMLEGIEPVLIDDRPDTVVVYGDTNSTLAAAIAACKLEINLVHIEAGLRSYNRSMPEEHNRVLTDHCATVLCCPTETAVENLAREGLTDGVHLVGDTMYDLILRMRPRAREQSDVVDRLGLSDRPYSVATVHRAYNTDDPARLASILEGLGALGSTVVLPVHPRTRKIFDGGGDDPVAVAPNVRLVDPLSYIDMLRLVDGSDLVLTDSGGLQKEAYWLGVPCITLRPETEWVETVETGWNVIADADAVRIVTAAGKDDWPQAGTREAFGRGDAGKRIVDVIEEAVAN